MDLPKKIVLIVASQGFQPVEYFATKEVLEDLGHTVITACDKDGIAKSSQIGLETKVDIGLANLRVQDYDGIFIIGGPGAMIYLNNEIVYMIMNQAYQSGKLWGGICIAPRILVDAGLMIGKKATGWDGDGQLSDIFTAVGAYYIQNPVVADGALITANGPASAKEWGQKIADLCLSYE